MSNDLKKEMGIWLLSIGTLIYLLRDLLIFGQFTYIHDNLYWNFPPFHFFAENLIFGNFPFWNPFTHGGEPFYPILFQIRLLDPITLLTIGFGKYFSTDTVVLFNWNRFLQNLVMLFGVYLVLRRFTRHIWIRAALVPILLFSSFLLVSFRQDGILSAFAWAPYLTYFLLNILYKKQNQSIHWICLATFLGLHWQSYHFAGTHILVGVLLVAFLLFHKNRLKWVVSHPHFKKNFSLCLMLVVLMALPNIVLLLEKDRFVYPLRMVPPNYHEILMSNKGLLPREGDPSFVQPSFLLSYDFLEHTGAFVKIWEFLQMLSPDANPNIHLTRFTGTHPWGSPSEAYLFIGLIPFAIALYGMFLGKHPLKPVWLFFTLVFGVLAMGPPGGLHRVLFLGVPPLWFLRHTVQFSHFFLMGFLFFFIIGCNQIVRNRSKINLGTKGLLASLLFGALIAINLKYMTQFDYPVFKFPETRYLFLGIIALVTIGWLLKPWLKRFGLFLSILIGMLGAVL